MTAWLASPVAFYAGLSIFIFVGITLLFWVQAKSIPKDPADDPAPDLQSAFERLLDSGYDRAFAAIGFEGCQKTIQVRKYIHARGDRGLELRIALGGLSWEKRQSLLDICSRQGMSPMVGREVPDDAGEFLFVDFGTDVAAASGMVGTLAAPALLVANAGRPYWTLHGLNRRLRVIDDPNLRPPDGHGLILRMEEIAQRTDLSPDQRYQLLSRTLARHGQSPADALWALLWFLTGPPAVLALLYALPWKLLWRASLVEPVLSIFEVTLFGVPIHPYRFDLVCLSLIVAAAIFFRQLPLKRISVRPLSQLEEAYRRSLLFGVVPAILVASLALWII